MIARHLSLRSIALALVIAIGALAGDECERLIERLATERAGFLHALLEADDHTAGLVYADYLQERGDAASVKRAAAIRTALDLEVNPPGRWNILDGRQRRLTKLRKELSWDTVAFKDESQKKIRGTLVFRGGVATGIEFDGDPDDAFYIPRKEYDRLIAQLPELTFIRVKGSKRNLLQDANIDGYMKAVLRGHPGALAHLQDRLGKTAEDLFAENEAGQILLEVFAENFEIHPDGLATMRQAFERVPVTHGTPLPRYKEPRRFDYQDALCRFLSGKAHAVDLALLMSTEPGDAFVALAVQSLSHQLAGMNRSEAMKALMPLTVVNRRATTIRLLERLIASDPGEAIVEAAKEAKYKLNTQDEPFAAGTFWR